MAQEYFAEWLPSGASFLKGFSLYMSEGDWKKAAFPLHQATESLYHGVLLVTTFYTPHVHMAAHPDLIKAMILASLVATLDHARRQLVSKGIAKRTYAEEQFAARLVIALAWSC